LLFKFELEFHQTENQQPASPMLCYDDDFKSELWSHKSKQNCLCLYSGNAKQM